MSHVGLVCVLSSGKPSLKKSFHLSIFLDAYLTLWGPLWHYLPCEASRDTFPDKPDDSYKYLCGRSTPLVPKVLVYSFIPLLKF